MKTAGNVSHIVAGLKTSGGAIVDYTMPITRIPCHAQLRTQALLGCLCRIIRAKAIVSVYHATSKHHATGDSTFTSLFICLQQNLGYMSWQPFLTPFYFHTTHIFPLFNTT
jgi:hypothetical protein